MFLGALDYGLLFSTVVPLNIFEDLQMLHDVVVEETGDDVLPAVRYHFLCKTQRNTNYSNLNWSCIARQLTCQ